MIRYPINGDRPPMTPLMPKSKPVAVASVPSPTIIQHRRLDILV